MISNGRDRVGDRDLCQANTAIKSTITNCCDGVGDRDLRQADTPVECIVSNGSDRIRDHDLLQAETAIASESPGSNGGDSFPVVVSW